MRISDWSSDVCSSDLDAAPRRSRCALWRITIPSLARLQNPVFIHRFQGAGMSGKFEISKRANGEFQFDLKAGNGQVILSSEGYSANGSCINGIESVRQNNQDNARSDRKTASKGKFFLNITTTHGHTVGRNPKSPDATTHDTGIAPVK